MMSDAPSAVDVQDWLTEALDRGPERGRSCCEITGPVYEGSHSRIFRGRLDSRPFPVAIKLCRDPLSGRPAPREAEMQFNALQRVTDALAGSAEVRVPAPVALLRERGVVVSEWVDGRTVGALCRDWRSSTSTVLDAVQRGGRWLAAFHKAHALDPRPVDAKAILDGTAASIAEDGGLDPAAPETAAALALLHRSKTIVAEIAVPCSRTHGDFKPDNVILSRSLIFGLDTGANYENVVLLDVAHFLNHLELDLFHPGAARLAFQRNRLLAAFWSGYAAADLGQSIPEAWMRLAMVLRLAAARGALGGGLRGRYVSWCFRRVIALRFRALEIRLEKAGFQP